MVEVLEILDHLNYLGDEVVYKGHGTKPPLNSYEVVSRLILAGPKTSKEEVFCEMSGDTAARVLRATFGKVSPRGSNTWYLYALGLVNKRYCLVCEKIIKKPSEYCPNCRRINNAAYYQEHKAEVLANKIKRQVAIVKATPVWANLNKMNEFYKNCPEGMEVDHWAPIQGELVCGLHTLDNLQYLPVAENRAKSNKFKPTDILA